MHYVLASNGTAGMLEEMLFKVDFAFHDCLKINKYFEAVLKIKTLLCTWVREGGRVYGQRSCLITFCNVISILLTMSVSDILMRHEEKV